MVALPITLEKPIARHARYRGEHLAIVCDGELLDRAGFEARFQKVSDVLIVERMPRNVAGKTLKNELKENYLANRK